MAVLVVLGAALVGLWVANRPAGTATTPGVEVYFSPRGGCTEAIIARIEAARESIFVQAYSFTSAPIAKALVDAHKRGVRVEAILDKSQRSEKYTEADFLSHMGIPTAIDDAHAIAHNKVMILDSDTVITGSFNFTKSAEQSNAENLLVICDAALAARYAANWREHRAHSEPYQRGPESPDPAASTEAGPAQADYDPLDQFLTSANSDVFHRRGCRLGDKIAAHNLVSFATRGEAVAAGKRPCAECKP